MKTLLTVSLPCQSFSTNGAFLQADADRLGVPVRSLEDVTAALAKAAKVGANKSMARLMLKWGRLSPEARAYVEAYPK